MTKKAIIKWIPGQGISIYHNGMMILASPLEKSKKANGKKERMYKLDPGTTKEPMSVPLSESEVILIACFLSSTD